MVRLPTRRRFMVPALGALATMAGASALVLTLPSDTVLVATLAPAQRDYQIVASFIVGRDTLRFARTPGPAAAPGRATQVWALTPDGAAVPLGRVAEESAWRVTLPPVLIPLAASLTIAVTDEAAGSLAQRPGPVLDRAPLRPQD